MRSDDLQVLEFQLNFTASWSGERDENVNALARTLNVNNNNSTLLNRSMLSEFANSDHYLTAVIIREQQDLRFELRYLRVPSSPPPDRLRMLREQGHTMEWFGGQLQRLLGNEKLAFVVHAYLCFDSQEFHKNAIFNKLLYQGRNTLSMAENTLSLAGLEFRGELRAGSLHRFRWYEPHNGHYHMELHYSYLDSWREADPWQNESARIQRYVDSLAKEIPNEQG